MGVILYFEAKEVAYIIIYLHFLPALFICYVDKNFIVPFFIYRLALFLNVLFTNC